MADANLRIILGLKDEASAGLGKITSGLGGLGAIGFGALSTGLLAAAAGIAAIGSACIGALASTMSWAGTLDDVSDILGTTSEDSAKLAVALRGRGEDVGQFTSQLAFMARSLETADGKLGPAGKALEGLGINFKDANGNILPTMDLLPLIADKLDAMPEGLNKTQLMMDIFGRSAKGMSDALGGLTTKGLAEADKKAKALGLSMGPDMVAKSEQLGYAFNDIKLMAQGLMVTLGSELLPVIKPLIDQFLAWAISVMPQVRDGIQVVAQWVMTFLIPCISAMWTWITTKLIPALSDMVTWFQTNIPPAIEGIRTIFEAVITFLQPFIDAFILAINGKWYEFGAKLREIWDQAWQAILQIGQTIWNNIVTFFTTTDWGAVGMSILRGIAAGISAGLSFVRDAIVAVVQAAIAAAKGFLGIKSPSIVFAGIGKNMMAGMAMGISGNARLPIGAVVRATNAMTQYSYSIASGAIQVNAAPGQSPNQIADVVMTRLNRQIAAARNNRMGSTGM